MDFTNRSSSGIAPIKAPLFIMSFWLFLLFVCQSLIEFVTLQSPQKVKAILEDVSHAVEKERGLVADADKHVRDLHAKLEVISKVRTASFPGNNRMQACKA